jgi:hypothetical protein
MKKYIYLCFLPFFSLSLFGQCPNSNGNSIHTKLYDYGCYQYVRAALLGGYVNMSTGIPTNESVFTNYPNVTIQSDQNFIQVCSKTDAKAVVPVGGGAGHNAIILNNGLFASTPNSGPSAPDVHSHQSPRAFTSACSEEYYAAIPDIAISGITAVNQGTQFTLTLTNNGQPLPSYLQLSDEYWTFNSNYFIEVVSSTTATSITLIAKNLAGISNVKYDLLTGCNGNNNFRT